jgi:hypothetical protein
MVDEATSGVNQIRVRIHHISPMVWWRLLSRIDGTIADLHDVTQVDFGRSDITEKVKSTA